MRRYPARLDGEQDPGIKAGGTAWYLESKKPELQTCSRGLGDHGLEPDKGSMTALPRPVVSGPPVLTLHCWAMRSGEVCWCLDGASVWSRGSGTKPHPLAPASRPVGTRKRGRRMLADWPLLAARPGLGARLALAQRSRGFMRDPSLPGSRSTCGHCLPTASSGHLSYTSSC